MRSDIPKIASKDRLSGTAEENRAVAQGVLSQFGTYSVNEASGTITLHVETSSFPNENGTDHERITGILYPPAATPIGHRSRSIFRTLLDTIMEGRLHKAEAEIAQYLARSGRQLPAEARRPGTPIDKR
jgi:hypothetical protein